MDNPVNPNASVDPRTNPEFGLGLLYLLDSLGRTLADTEATMGQKDLVIAALKDAHRHGAADESPADTDGGSTLPSDEEEPTP